ncbi:MAG: RNA methyltransferase [Flavobacteriales bacterium]|nr:RNA methyltransferase [Flavobacteriales bacterium]|tara:strand:- start:1162 stop:1689 length:528 start_codon:yes stop_codon:yes gene_type:complete
MRKLKNSELERISVENFKSSNKTPIVVVLDNVRSALNVGSAFRTSDAFRIEKVYLCGITSAPPNKEIRKSALGSTKSVEWEKIDNTDDAILQLKKQGYTICSVEQVENSTLLHHFSLTGKPIAVVFGNEVNGVQQSVIDNSDYCIEIPQIGTKHSLNISVSIGVVLWDLYNKITG